LAHAC